MGLWEAWKAWSHQRKFTRVGRNCRMPVNRLEVDGVVTLGDECVVMGNNTIRTHGEGSITIGNGVVLSDHVMIQSDCRVEVQDGAYLGPYVVLRDTNHSFVGTDIHWRLTPLLLKPILVGANAYLGAGVYVLPGVTIGEGAVVTPQSIVNKDVPANEVWGGSPASFIVDREDPARHTKLKRQLWHATPYGFEFPEESETAG